MRGWSYHTTAICDDPLDPTVWSIICLPRQHPDVMLLADRGFANHELMGCLQASRSKSGAFELENSRLRCEAALERLHLVAALALLYATTQGMSVQIAGLPQQVDPHRRRGISYLKIGSRWLQGVVYKGRQLLRPIALLPQDPQPCFASNRAERDFYNQFWFTRIRSLTCNS